MGLTEGIIFGLIAMISWGTSDFFLKKVTDKIGSERSLFWTSLVAFTPLLVYFLIIPTKASGLENYLFFLLVSVALDFLSAVFFFKAVGKGQISIISPYQSSYVIISVVLSLVFLRESLTPFQSVGIGLTVAGIILVAFKYSELRKMKLKNVLPGIPEDTVSLIFVGINMVVIGFLASKLGWFYPIFVIRTSTAVLAFLFLLSKRMKLTFDGKLKIPIIIIGLTSVLGFLAYSVGASSEQISVMAPVTATFPLVTVILARIFYKEKTELIQKIGIAGIILGIVILSAV